MRIEFRKSFLPQNSTNGKLLLQKNQIFGLILAVFLLCFLTGASKVTTIQYVSPVPDSKMVSAQTNIIMRIGESLVSSIEKDTSLFVVIGSLSGKHQGHVSVSDDNETVMFKPHIPFTPGEIVTVHLRTGIRTRRGSTNRPLDFSFTISYLTEYDQMHTLLSEQAKSNQIIAYAGNQTVTHSPPLNKRAQIKSLPQGFPVLKLITSNNPSPGYLFLSSYKTDKPGNHMQYAPFVQSDQQFSLIVDNSGTPVYYKKMSGFNTDFKVQPNGHLTYFDNSVPAYYELDTDFTVTNIYTAQNGYIIDSHEFNILPNGHVLFLCQDREPVDMSKIVSGGDPSAFVMGFAIQELDKNKNLVFQWRSFDHFQITDATQEDFTQNLIDYVHPNTVELDTDGNILLSSRHMDEITKIDHTTGNIIWRWGGKHNQFTFLNDTIRFSHQHTIRRTISGTYVLFDNGNFRIPAFSRVVEYALDEKAKTATLVWQYRHTPDIFSIAMGSVQRLPNGNTLIGWGTGSPALTEVRPDGTTTLELQFPDSIVSYRAFRSPWPLSSSTTNTGQIKNETITSFTLHQNYPNPFNPSTTIQFDLKNRAHVNVAVYDMLGRVIATLMEKELPAGSYSVPFDATGQSSGTYLVVLKVTGGDQNGKSVHTYTRKMVLNK